MPITIRMQPFRRPARRAAYQPKEPEAGAAGHPDQAFNDLFTGWPATGTGR